MIRRNLPADKVLASAVVLLQDESLNFSTKTIADDAPCFNTMALMGSDKDPRVLVRYGIGWDVQGISRWSAACKARCLIAPRNM